MKPRDFAAELAAARVAEDWAAHERIWEERRIAAVEEDERFLAKISLDRPVNAP